MKTMVITFTDEDARKIELLSDLFDTPQVEIVERAVSTHAFICRELKMGSKVFLQQKDGTVKEVVFDGLERI